MTTTPFDARVAARVAGTLTELMRGRHSSWVPTRSRATGRSSGSLRLGRPVASQDLEARLNLVDAPVEPAVGGDEDAVPLGEPDDGARELLHLGRLAVDAVLRH